MKRVLIIVNTGLLNAGVPRVMMDIFENLSNEYQFDFVVCSKSKGYFDNFLIERGSRIYYIGPKRALNWKEEHLFTIFIRFFRLFGILLKNRYDIIHSNSGFVSGDDMFLAWLCGVKKRIVHAHGTYNLPTLFITKLYHNIHLALIKLFATHRIAVSKIAGETLFNGKCFDLIYNSVDFELYRIVKPIEHDGLNVLQVGYFCSNKNQLFALECLKDVLKYRNPVHLYFIGFEIEKGYLNQMNSYIKANNLKRYVTFLPHDYNKFDLYPYLDLALIPSYTEGLSVFALECQAAGVRCLASYGVPEDANMGLLKRIALENKEEWVRNMISRSPHCIIDESKIRRFDRNNFIKAIRFLYNDSLVSR